MILDLADMEIRARLASISGGRVRLTLEYPHEARYRDRVMRALSDLLRPPSASKGKAARPKSRQEATHARE